MNSYVMHSVISEDIAQICKFGFFLCNLNQSEKGLNYHNVETREGVVSNNLIFCSVMRLTTSGIKYMSGK